MTKYLTVITVTRATKYLAFFSFLLLLFAESNNLFVPVELFHSLTKTLGKFIQNLQDHIVRFITFELLL
jgi:hypothetical protein